MKHIQNCKYKCFDQGLTLKEHEREKKLIWIQSRPGLAHTEFDPHNPCICTHGFTATQSTCSGFPVADAYPELHVHRESPGAMFVQMPLTQPPLLEAQLLIATQLLLGPVYPISQWQVFVPGPVIVQMELLPHPPLLVEH